jgi:chromosome segregation protein
MYLSRIEIFGFKSFANKTVINLNRGVTGIVGPNGCGKSNIVDALRWVVGEQRASVLRSDKMEAVIFNGTKDKKPLGMAEVSLTIVNDRGLLPSEYSEVTITRRIYRSGESEYLLNKNVCRYKDIVNLFMDTGLSSNAYSVIELKMVEAVIGNKADERRAMFEEAAGISKFKLRKRLSLKKLEEVRNDLTRVDDILSEVQRKVSSLERQAKRADKYHQLRNELREKELDLAQHEYAFYHNKKQAILVDREFDLREKERLENEINTLDEQISDDRFTLEEFEEKISNFKDEIANTTEKIFKIEQSISINEERKKSIINNKTRIEGEIEELKSDIEYNNDLIEDLNFKLDEVSNEINNLLEENELLSEEINSIRNSISHKKSILSDKREKNLSIIKEKNSAENKLNSLNKSIERKKNDIEKSESLIKQLNDTISSKQNELDKLLNNKNELEKNIETLKNKIEEKKSIIKLLQEQYNDLIITLNNKNNELKNIDEKSKLIESFINSLKQLNSSNQSILDSDSFNNVNIFNTLFNITTGYKAAIQSIFKYILNNIVVDNIEDLININNYLQSNNLGKAEILIKEFQITYQKPFLLKFITNYYDQKIKENIEKETFFKGFAISYIQSDSSYTELFKRLLNNFIVTDSFENAIIGIKKYPQFNFVTIKGDLILNNGLVITGSEITDADTLSGKEELLIELENNKNKIILEISELETQISETKTQLEVENKILNDLITQDKAHNDNIQKTIISINKLHSSLENLNENLVSEQNKVQNYKTDIENLENELNNTKTFINTFTENGIDENSIKQIEDEIDDLEEQLNEKIQRENDLKIKIEKSRSLLKSYEQQLERANDEIEEANNNIENYEQQLEELNLELSNIDTYADDYYIQLDNLIEKKNELIQQENKLVDSIKDLKTKVHTIDNKIRELRKEKDTIADRLRDYDIKLSQIEMQVKTLTENIKVDYGIDLTYTEFEDLENYDFDTITEEVFNLKQQIKNLGPVNTLAYEEYEEEKQRLDFMLKQREDLIQSEKDLLQTIEEINTTATQQFLTTFEQIRQNFIAIFRTLFNPGDEADLRLEEGIDPLEAKIEIIAKPKGKRPTVISLLSGGEKTLTATALLFAIYMIKPSPYCVMDEVDAPLDDANVGRFTRLIHQFKDRTQFIIVTHNKKTMEAAETMYGVTMQEEGISKLVSVQFGNELKVYNQN